MSNCVLRRVHVIHSAHTLAVMFHVAMALRNIAGTTVKVTTVDGLVDLKIPGGTQPGTTLVMSKRGVPRLGASNSRGDHQVLYVCSSTVGCITESRAGV